MVRPRRELAPHGPTYMTEQRLNRLIKIVEGFAMIVSQNVISSHITTSSNNVSNNNNNNAQIIAEVNMKTFEWLKTQPIDVCGRTPPDGSLSVGGANRKDVRDTQSHL